MSVLYITCPVFSFKETSAHVYYVSFGFIHVRPAPIRILHPPPLSVAGKTYSFLFYKYVAGLVLWINHGVQTHNLSLFSGFIFLFISLKLVFTSVKVPERYK